jgi:hypothetical protein
VFAYAMTRYAEIRIAHVQAKRLIHVQFKIEKPLVTTPPIAFDKNLEMYQKYKNCIKHDLWKWLTGNGKINTRDILLGTCDDIKRIECFEREINLSHQQQTNHTRI